MCSYLPTPHTPDRQSIPTRWQQCDRHAQVETEGGADAGASGHRSGGVSGVSRWFSYLCVTLWKNRLWVEPSNSVQPEHIVMHVYAHRSQIQLFSFLCKGWGKRRLEASHQLPKDTVHSQKRPYSPPFAPLKDSPSSKGTGVQSHPRPHVRRQVKFVACGLPQHVATHINPRFTERQDWPVPWSRVRSRLGRWLLFDTAVTDHRTALWQIDVATQSHTTAATPAITQ